MAETKNPFQEQIMRCSSLQRFPLYPEGIRELRDTLKSAAGNPERAQRVIDEILEGDICPTPSEIRVRASRIRDREEEIPSGCDDCHGRPWVTMQVQAHDLNGHPVTLESSKRCKCAKGAWFRAKDLAAGVGSTV